ncbi:hypothetical protein GOZ96_04845 [Agrobacterium vitis]|uniref:hypothetical protein n=1 Tax=Agrobacterium vitis TaxID=373 RepID=UPI0012E957C9|nr:hypothetical protein [Agrobacterium vitis]MUZ95917.1 hypothetical protein [Agrobacterium vitis]
MLAAAMMDAGDGPHLNLEVFNWYIAHRAHSWITLAAAAAFAGSCMPIRNLLVLPHHMHIGIPVESTTLPTSADLMYFAFLVSYDPQTQRTAQFCPFPVATSAAMPCTVSLPIFTPVRSTNAGCPSSARFGLRVAIGPSECTTPSRFGSNSKCSPRAETRPATLLFGISGATESKSTAENLVMQHPLIFGCGILTCL